jgi:hypothetical protein
MLIEVVIICELSGGTEPKDEKEDEKTEQTIIGISKYFESEVNLINRFLCFSERV